MLPAVRAIETRITLSTESAREGVMYPAQIWVSWLRSSHSCRAQINRRFQALWFDWCYCSSKPNSHGATNVVLVFRAASFPYADESYETLAYDFFFLRCFSLWKLLSSWQKYLQYSQAYGCQIAHLGCPRHSDVVPIIIFPSPFSSSQSF